MNGHALRVLEFPAVLELVAGRSTTELGAARVRGLAPRLDRAWLREEHARVAAVRAISRGPEGWRPEPVEPLAEPLSRLRVQGSRWSSHELLSGALLLRSSRRTRMTLSDERNRSESTAPLQPFAQRMLVATAQEQAIERAIDPDGLVRDEASPALRKLRRELRGAESELVTLLERLMARLEPHHRVADMSVTVRNGRYVIPVRREGRGAVGGIVHDESATRGTLFVEPPAAVEMGNRIRELEVEEVREVDRILAELTDALRPHRDEMSDSLDALVELDALYARARFADDFACGSATLGPGREGFDVRTGRHPLLLARGGTVVPFDLEMAPGERTLLISGPNTGGKTVLLKALGLFSAMMQAGIPATVGDASRVAIVDDVFADIGDEQSIEASLSTFSAHLRNLGEILDRATSDSLVLMDELGAGTDPAEGAALGGAILEELTARGTLTVATTHLGTLKELASENPSIVNASLQFDSVALAPTYQLTKGIPGRSYGLGIARRLQLPAHVLARAEERLPAGERDLAVLIAELERREAILRERESDTAADAERARAQLDRVGERERAVREAERSHEREARQAVRRYLLDARAEVERAIAEVRAGASADIARDARRRVEELIRVETDALDTLDHAAPAGQPSTREPIDIGALVEVDSLGGRLGRVIETRGDDVVVSIGVLKVTVPIATVRRSSTREPAAEVATAIGGDLPEITAPTDVDLRGMRVDEIDPVLLHAIDSAVRAERGSLRIIHGKGTGALRARVAEMLRADDRVKQFRLGAWNEGGAGVTVATFA